MKAIQQKIIQPTVRLPVNLHRLPNVYENAAFDLYGNFSDHLGVLCRVLFVPILHVRLFESRPSFGIRDGRGDKELGNRGGDEVEQLDEVRSVVLQRDGLAGTGGGKDGIVRSQPQGHKSDRLSRGGGFENVSSNRKHVSSVVSSETSVDDVVLANEKIWWGDQIWVD